MELSALRPAFTAGLVSGVMPAGITTLALVGTLEFQSWVNALAGRIPQRQGAPL